MPDASLIYNKQYLCINEMCIRDSLYGVLPANREAYVLKGDIPDPALYLARYLTDQLLQKGIRVDGSPSCYRSEVEENRWKKGERKEIVTTYSPTLREIARCV